MPDQSMTVTQQTAMEERATRTTTGLKSLNVTANTIASNYNNASVMTTATAATVMTMAEPGGCAESRSNGASWTRRLNPNQVDLCHKFFHDQLEFVGRVLLEGTYSRVEEARLTMMTAGDADGDEQQQQQQTVLVKIAGERASKEQAQRMLVESAMLRGLKHKNVSAVLGVCLPDADSGSLAMSVFPHCEIGNMKTFLIDFRERNYTQHTDQDVRNSFSPNNSVMSFESFLRNLIY